MAMPKRRRSCSPVGGIEGNAEAAQGLQPGLRASSEPGAVLVVNGPPDANGPRGDPPSLSACPVGAVSSANKGGEPGEEPAEEMRRESALAVGHPSYPRPGDCVKVAAEEVSESSRDTEPPARLVPGVGRFIFLERPK